MASEARVIPVKAGIQGRSVCGQVWMPAFAGMEQLRSLAF